MVSLSIFAFSSTAMSSLMFATFNTNRHVKSTTDGSAQAEIAIRRIIETTRSAADIIYSSPSTGLLIQTPPDSNNLSYIFIYYAQNNQLRERIQTAGSLTLIQDTVLVEALATNGFTVTRTNPGSFPESYSVQITLATTPVAVTRTVTITGRNLTQ